MEYLEKERQFNKLLSDTADFIKSPEDFIHTFCPDVEEKEVIELLRFVHIHNVNIIESQRKHIESLRKKINTAKPVEYKEEVEKESIPIIEEPFKPKVDPTYINSIISSPNLLTELEGRLPSLNKDEITYLKLQLHLMKLKLQALIRKKVMINPSSSIKQEQDNLENIELATIIIADFQKEEEESVEEVKATSRIIFVPNKNSSYIYDDIAEYENRKEIKITFDKLVDGYFLKTKDVKSIEGIKNANLCEYTHPNGIRILYVVSDDIICVCSLFYKDKQRSKKITSYYEEATKRFLSQVEYIRANYQSPDFYIEQDEIIGKINSLLETGKKLKKGGDSNE